MLELGQKVVHSRNWRMDGDGIEQGVIVERILHPSLDGTQVRANLYKVSFADGSAKWIPEYALQGA